MHGGISERIQSLQQLRQLKRPATDYDAQRPCAELDLLWADPEQGIKGTVPSTRGNELFFWISFINFYPFFRSKRHVRWGSRHAHTQAIGYRLDCPSSSGLNFMRFLLIILHSLLNLQVVQDGAEFFADRRLITLFSAPHYAAQYNNAGATMQVSGDLQCTFHIFAPTDDAQLHWCDKDWWRSSKEGRNPCDNSPIFSSIIVLYKYSSISSSYCLPNCHCILL